ncbi:nicotianamine synthase family protein [Peribacillus muralis]|uniref:nicotianamine synthase family protein n=1 Tax=Peribacillus muralis TaxID=264697 RepID=UPI000AA582F9|nr:nicotianamine synthase family protein [Peribacillus muralis]
MKTIKWSRNQEKIIHTYMDTYKILLEEKDLSPKNPIINRVLTELVSLISKPLDQHMAEEILNHDQIRSIRGDMLDKLTIAETSMENHYANLFVGSVNTLEDFRSFLYWGNYKELIKTEINELKKVKNDSQSFAFVGTGPLPLSPLLLQQELGANMTCLDIDEQAYSLGKRIIKQLKGEATSNYILNDGALHDYGEFDLVWIASLVPNKEEILERIYETNPHATVAIRSVDGIHQLLYEPVDATKFSKVICQEVGRTIADSFIINSTVFYTFR